MNDRRSLELGAVVGQVVVRLDDEDLEHEDRVERRPAAFGPVGVVERRLELGPEHLEVDDAGERLELVAEIAQPRQAVLDVKEPRLSAHRKIPPAANRPRVNPIHPGSSRRSAVPPRHQHLGGGAVALLPPPSDHA